MVSGLLLLAVNAARAGGWAVLTLAELPPQVVAGDSFTVRFAVRQHGNHLASGLDSFVTAVHTKTGQALEFKAEPADKAGYYKATMMLPHSGAWDWEIEAFGLHTMPPLTVVDRTATVAGAAGSSRLSLALVSPWQIAGLAALAGGVLLMIAGWRRPSRTLQGTAVAAMLAGAVLGFAAPANPATTAVAQHNLVGADADAQGEALFVAKGCITCHRHDGISYTRNLFVIGPDLSDYQSSPEFLRLWLRDPAQVRPQTLMPDLELAEAEIEALLAFLNREAKTAVSN